MRPISLKIEGFTSFKGEVDIDFSELEVFAITGDNGAGKSSVLEAMLFALYGKTYRLGKEKKDLVSLGSDKAAVHFEFLADSRRYRVTRSFKPKGNPFMKLELLSENGWTTIAEQTQVNEEVERILRLPFDAFTKAVLIPQGHFDALLKPREPKERRKILIDLFDLGVYDLMRVRANEIVKHAEGEEAQISSSLQNRYSSATPEHRREIASEKKELAIAVKDLNKKKGTLAAQVDRIRQVLALKSSRDTVAARLEELRLQLPIHEKRSQEAIGVLKRAVAEDETRAPALETELRALTQSVEKLQLIARKEQEWQRLQQVLAKSQAEIERLKKLHDKILRQSVALASAVDKQKSVLAGHKFREDFYHRLEAVYGDALNLTAARSQHRDLASRIDAECREVTALEVELSALKTAVAQFEVELKSEQQQAELAKREEQVLELKMHLRAGEECPVCGAPVKRAASVPEARIREMHKLHLALIEKLEVAEKKLQTGRAEESKKDGEIQFRKRNLREHTSQAETLLKGIKQTNSKLQRALKLSPDVNADAYVSEQYGVQKELAGDFRRLKKNLEEQERELHLIESDFQAKTADLRVASAEEAQKRVAANALGEELNGLRDDLPEWIDSKLSIENALASAEKRAGELTRQVNALRRARQEAAVALAEIQNDEKHARETFRAEEEKLKEQDDLIRQLSDEEAGFSELLLETLRSRLRTAEDDHARTERRLGEVTQLLEQMDILLKEMKEQTARLEKVRKDREIYGLLAKHLASNQLQDYVVSTLLEQLLENANLFLKDLTQGRYLLQLQKESFVVLDSWASGQSRIVETLSGGESFVASLALALALSDFVKGGALLESIFIDEGFGSLHKDKLDLVYEALGALSGTGKMIGLVTHIEELASRFPVRLHITNAPSGSQIKTMRSETIW